MGLVCIYTTDSWFQRFFIQCGTYLILEKLTVLAYRNLFKQVWVWYVLCTGNVNHCILYSWKKFLCSYSITCTCAHTKFCDWSHAYCRYLILGTHQIPLDAFCDALHYMQVCLRVPRIMLDLFYAYCVMLFSCKQHTYMQVEDIDTDETQCIVASLIDKVCVVATRGIHTL